MGTMSMKQSVMWRKSSRSQDQTLGCCVELASFGVVRAIRDSKNPDGPRLRLSGAEFRMFLDDVKNGSYAR
jgi:hypothetical protein